MATHVVVKPFDGSGKTRYVPGQVVDATAWPNVRTLVEARYLRVRTVAESERESEPRVRPIRVKG